MREDLVEQEIIDIISYIKDVAAFSKEQLPSVASQILEYGYVSNLTGVIVLGIISLVSAFTALANIKDMPFFSCVWTLIFTVWTICCVDSLIKVSYAPKLYLLTYLKDFIS
jgi:hypothetical protein